MRSWLALLGPLVFAVSACATGDVAGDTAAEPSMFRSRQGASPAAVQSAIESAALPECPATSEPPAVGGGLPAITLDCLGAGPAVAMSGLAGSSGRPLVVNIWASWCTPCADEMPRLTAAARDYAGAVDFIGVDILDDRVAALEWAAAFGMNFPSLLDHDGELRGPLNIQGPPVTFFVDTDGRIAHTFYGEIPNDEALRVLIAEQLGVER